MHTVIRAENLSKKFRIGKLRRDEGTLRDVIGNIIRHPFTNRRNNQNPEMLWALRDISFEIKQGETFGVIGRNGAGKSTLLKILSRIIKPTGGRAKLDGRVGSLLEIGTGFHPDLTGRENVFLNGAVLGMRRREVEKKFDEIVSFADLEKFLDTPVKFYSSGMYARLAFAVAAHLEPEILIIDEVLSVGDAVFQAKCLGKMGRAAEGGRTVIFVSHDAGTVTKLCKTGIYLEKGRIKKYGDMRDVMAQYEADNEPAISAQSESRNAESVNEGEAKFIEWNVVNSKAKIPHDVISREMATFEFVFISRRSPTDINFRFMIKDLNDRTILAGNNAAEIKEGTHRLQWTCELPLKPDNYRIFVEAYSPDEQIVLNVWKCEPELTVISDDFPHIEQLEGLINVPISFNRI